MAKGWISDADVPEWLRAAPLPMSVTATWRAVEEIAHERAQESAEERARKGHRLICLQFFRNAALRTLELYPSSLSCEHLESMLRALWERDTRAELQAEVEAEALGQPRYGTGWLSPADFEYFSCFWQAGMRAMVYGMRAGTSPEQLARELAFWSKLVVRDFRSELGEVRPSNNLIGLVTSEPRADGCDCGHGYAVVLRDRAGYADIVEAACSYASREAAGAALDAKLREMLGSLH
jgi:hypothetical protein